MDQHVHRLVGLISSMEQLFGNSPYIHVGKNGEENKGKLKATDKGV